MIKPISLQIVFLACAFAAETGVQPECEQRCPGATAAAIQVARLPELVTGAQTKMSHSLMELVWDKLCAHREAVLCVGEHCEEPVYGDATLTFVGIANWAYTKNDVGCFCEACPCARRAYSEIDTWIALAKPIETDPVGGPYNSSLEPLAVAMCPSLELVACALTHPQCSGGANLSTAQRTSLSGVILPAVSPKCELEGWSTKPRGCDDKNMAASTTTSAAGDAYNVQASATTQPGHRDSISQQTSGTGGGGTQFATVYIVIIAASGSLACIGICAILLYLGVCFDWRSRLKKRANLRQSQVARARGRIQPAEHTERNVEAAVQEPVRTPLEKLSLPATQASLRPAQPTMSPHPGQTASSPRTQQRTQPMANSRQVQPLQNSWPGQATANNARAGPQLQLPGAGQQPMASPRQAAQSQSVGHPQPGQSMVSPGQPMVSPRQMQQGQPRASPQQQQQQGWRDAPVPKATWTSSPRGA
eukprot:TRINITY_DN103620_c0_g1_i1.p1 TRINITY_DN103620_c0_g1~~TRINITY_DN103620_c0_g1_i1.p1  ORF type:complete len:476 (+),score=48.12 TRINITY_DN103620_c0_g1_i1:149-1576(+)